MTHDGFELWACEDKGESVGFGAGCGDLERVEAASCEGGEGLVFEVVVCEADIAEIVQGERIGDVEEDGC